MREKIVAGNWKMNTMPAEGVELAKEVAGGVRKIENAPTVILAPPFTHMSEVIRATRGSGVGVAAQNCAAERAGAYTGEVSAEMIAALGAEYVIIGHSERRQYYGDTAEVINRKMEQAYAAGLRPILCVGENIDQREAGQHFGVVTRQVEEVVYNLTGEQFKRLVIAYEPVWAIGTGKTASAAEAQQMHHHIRDIAAGKFDELAEDLPILYGGSVKPDNAAEIFTGVDVDGALVGGAALKAADFIAIAKSF